MGRALHPLLVRRLVIAGVVGLVLLSLAALIVTIGQPTNQCDNMAGTCLRGRQRLAICGIRLLALAAVGVGPAALAWRSSRGRLPAAAVVAMGLAGAFSAWVILMDPVARLNHRWDGWLGD